MKFWIAVYTRPRSEKKLRDFLEKLGIEIFLPVQKQLRQWSDRKKWIEVVVIPMIVFIKISKEELPIINNQSLILRPLRMPGNRDIQKIPSAEIDKLKYILGQSDYPVSFDSNYFKVNDKIRIVRGSLMGLTGEVLGYNETTSEVMISVGILGCAKMTINKAELELI